MESRSRILLSVISSIAVSLVIALTAFSILKGMNTELRQGPLYDDIIEKTQALSILTASFNQRSGQGEVSQVKGILHSLDMLLKRLTSRASGEEVLVRQLRRNNRELGPLIDQLFVSGRELSDDLERERRNILVSQVWMKVRFITDDTGRLRNLSQARVIAAQEKAGIVVLALIVLLALTNGGIYFLSGRGIMRAQNAQLESERHFRQVLESLPQLVWTCQPEGPCDYLSPQWTSYTGLPEAEQLGFGWLDQLHPDDRQRTIDHWQTTAGQGSLFAIEFRIRRHDGVYRWFHTLAVPLRDEAGGIVRWFGTNTDIDDQKRAEETIRTSLREKEVLLKEIHHRVKNNMQVISSLVSLQADGIKDEAVREALKDVTYRVRSMALVHEKLYQSNDLAHIDFAEYVRSLLSYLWRAHGSVAASIRLVQELEPVSLPVDIAVPCGLILNELAGNALKHAFKGHSEGEVTVSLQNGADGRIRLGVADNGVGLPTGFDWRQAKSLGLRLVQMLAGQLDASVEASGGDGTKFEITFGYQDSPE